MKKLISTWLVAWLAGSLAARGAEAPPNLVFILADDLGWSDLGCYGSTFYDTPALDRLAGEGVRFTDGYAACQVCSPTRAALMTGKYPARMSTTDWFGAPQPDNRADHWSKKNDLLPAPYREYLPLEEVTLAEALKEHGYHTFFAGKWHLGEDEGFWPEHQGFDVNRGGFFKGSPPGGYFSPYQNPRLEDGPVGEHLPARLADETVKFISDHRDGPFFAMLSFYSVHTPLQARDDLKAKYQERRDALGVTDGERFDPDAETWERPGSALRRVQDHPVYAGMVEAMDQAVGKVLACLDELGLRDNTYIVFTSDNGGLSTQEGAPTSNLPLRGGKGWMYEGGIRVPLLVAGPGIAGGGQSAVPVSSIDYYPTLLELAGLPLRPNQHLDGRSFAGVVHGAPPGEPRDLFWHYPHYGNQSGSPAGAIRSGSWKYIQFFEEGRPDELYDLANDIGEQQNLVDREPERADALRDRLLAWQRAVDARMPTPNPDAVPPAPPYQPTWESLKKHPDAPEWFRDAKLGIYFHWGVYSVPAFGSEWYPRNMFIKGNRENRHHIEQYGDPGEYGYDRFVEQWKTPNFHAQEWAALFRRAGARFAGPVAEHHDGFSLWDSQLTPWNAVDKGPGRDLVGELAGAIRGEGMRFITTFHHARNYYGHYDEMKKNYPAAMADPEVAFLYGQMPEDTFHDLWLGKLEEVIDRYQPDIIWFDSWLDRIPAVYRQRFAAYYLNQAAQWKREVVIVRKQDDLPVEFTVLDHEKSRESKGSPRTWMTDDTISTGSWCYTRDLTIKPTAKIIHALVDTVAKNGVVLLNISPLADGTIPDDQRKVLLELGDWLETNGEAIYATRPWTVFGEGPTIEPTGGFRDHGDFLKLEYSGKDIRYTRSKDGKTVYATTLGWPGPSVQFSALDVAATAPDASVELLGYNGRLRHTVTEDRRLVVDLPDLPPAKRPGEHAYSFKLQGFEFDASGASR